MHPWLSLFSDIRVGLLLALINNEDIGDGIESRFLLLGAETTVLAKGHEGTFSSCPSALALICSVLLFFL